MIKLQILHFFYNSNKKKQRTKSLMLQKSYIHQGTKLQLNCQQLRVLCFKFFVLISFVNTNKHTSFLSPIIFLYNFCSSKCFCLQGQTTDLIQLLTDYNLHFKQLVATSISSTQLPFKEYFFLNFQTLMEMTVLLNFVSSRFNKEFLSSSLPCLTTEINNSTSQGYHGNS